MSLRLLLYQNRKLSHKLSSLYNSKLNYQSTEVGFISTDSTTFSQIESYDGNLIDINNKNYDYLIYVGEDFNFLEEFVEIYTKFKFCIVLPISTELNYRSLFALHHTYFRSISIVPKSWLESDEEVAIKHICRLQYLSWRMLIVESLNNIEDSINYIEENYL